MEEIILKELIKNRCLDTCNDFVIWADKSDLEPLAKKIAEAINYTRCCTELPTEYSIAFAGFVATNVEVQGSEIKIIDSINGFGDKIPNKSVSVLKK